MTPATIAYHIENRVTLARENFSTKELVKQLENNCFVCTKIRLKIRDILEKIGTSRENILMTGRVKQAAALLIEILTRINNISETIFTLEQERKEGKMNPLFSMEKWPSRKLGNNSLEQCLSGEISSTNSRDKSELLFLRDQAIEDLDKAIEELYVLENRINAIESENNFEFTILPPSFPNAWEIWKQISLQKGALYRTIVAPTLDSLSKLWSVSEEAAVKERDKWQVLQQQITNCWTSYQLDKPVESIPLSNPLHIQLQQLLEGKGLRKFYGEGYTIKEMLLHLNFKKLVIGPLDLINEENEKLRKKFSAIWNSSERLQAEEMTEGFCTIFGEKFGWRELPEAVTTFLFMEYLALWELVDHVEKDEEFCKTLAGNSFFFLLEKLLHSNLLGSLIENAPVGLVKKALKKIILPSINEEAIQAMRLSCMGLEKEDPLQVAQWKIADRAMEQFIKAIALYFLENMSQKHDIRKITFWLKNLLAYQQSIVDYAKALTTMTTVKQRHLKREAVKEKINELLSATLSTMNCLAAEIRKNEKELELISKIDTLLKTFALPQQPLRLLDWLQSLLMKKN